MSPRSKITRHGIPLPSRNSVRTRLGKVVSERASWKVRP